jgi:hypothetical protein
MSGYRDRFETEVNRAGVSRISQTLGIARNTVYNWMANANVPLNQLLALEGLGVDIVYVLTGTRRSELPGLEPERDVANQDVAPYEPMVSPVLRSFVKQIGEWVASGQLKDEDIEVLAGMAARLAGPEPAVVPPPLPRTRPVVPERPPIPRNAEVYHHGEKPAVVVPRKTKKERK